MCAWPLWHAIVLKEGVLGGSRGVNLSLCETQYRDQVRLAGKVVTSTRELYSHDDKYTADEYTAPSAASSRQQRTA